MEEEGGEGEVDEFGRDKGEMNRRAREERLANMGSVAQKRKKIREKVFFFFFSFLIYFFLICSLFSR